MLGRAALSRIASLLARIQLALVPHLSTPQECCPGALPESVSFTAAPFPCRTLTMATLRLTLLVVFLMGLALLTAPRDTDGALARGLPLITPCRTEYVACTSLGQRCAQCVTTCKKAQASVMPVTASNAMIFCGKMVQALARGR